MSYKNYYMGVFEDNRWIYIFYSGFSQGIRVHIPCLSSISPGPSGEEDIENRQGI
jgi:hypothetical protein